MATITPIALVEQVASVALGIAAAAGGDEVVWTGSPLLVVFHNASGGAITATMDIPVSAQSGPAGPHTYADRTIVMAAGERRAIKISDAHFLLNASGRIAFTYSGVTSLTISALLI